MVDTRVPIVTIDADTGGVPALVDVAARLVRGWGRSVVVYRTRSEAQAQSRPDRLRGWLRHWRGSRTIERGLDAVHLPPPPFPLWLYFLVPQFLIGPMLGKHHAALVVTGSAHTALPLALRGMPFTLWVATIYEDEVRGKAEAGDEWARRTLNSPAWRVLEAQEKFVLRRAHRILALSEYTARRIRERVPGAGERMTVMPFPVDTSRFCPDPAVRADPPHGRYLLFAGRINDPRKNVGLLLRAYAQVRAQHPDLKLVLAGDTPGEPVRALVEELGIADSVVFAGSLPGESDDLLRLYQGAELFVLPSMQEGLGIVVLEALACGTPVVATACGGPEGIVIDGVTGRLVHDFHDPGVMATAILDLLADPAQLDAMRKGCAAFAAGRFAYPVVEATLREAHEATERAEPRAGRLHEWLALAWVLLVLAGTLQHQFIIHWPSIQARLIAPLLMTRP